MEGGKGKSNYVGSFPSIQASSVTWHILGMVVWFGLWLMEFDH